MKWRIGRFRSALKILFELRREFKDIDGDAKVLLYRVDGESDAIAVIGTFLGKLEGTLGLNAPAKPREFAIAIETFTPDVDFSPNLGVRLWFGDQALARAMNMPIDGKPNRLEFDGSGNALKMIKDLMFAESSFVALRGDNDNEED